MNTPERPGRPTTVPWRTLAIPTEHGGWGFLVEPLVRGLVLSPSTAGACLSLANLSAFLARHPLRLVLLDRRKGARHPRTLLAERFFAGYTLLALGLLAAAAGLARLGYGPWLATVAILALLARAAWGLSPEHRSIRPQALGFQEIGFGLLTVVLLAFGYRRGE